MPSFFGDNSGTLADKNGVLCVGCCDGTAGGGIFCNKYTFTVTGLPACAAEVNGATIVLCPVTRVSWIDGGNKLLVSYVGCVGQFVASYSPPQYGLVKTVSLDGPVGTVPGGAITVPLFYASGDNVVINADGSIAATQDDLPTGATTDDGCRYYIPF